MKLKKRLKNYELLTKKLKTYTVSINVNDMIFPEIGRIEVEAVSAAEAKEWAEENIRCFVEN